MSEAPTDAPNIPFNLITGLISHLPGVIDYENFWIVPVLGRLISPFRVGCSADDCHATLARHNVPNVPGVFLQRVFWSFSLVFEPLRRSEMKGCGASKVF